MFVRLVDDGGPSVAQMMAPYEAMVEPYRFEELKAHGRVALRPRTVNWKNIGDNCSDGLHITVRPPGPHPVVRAQLRGRGDRARRPHVGRHGSSGRRPTGPSAPTSTCCPTVAALAGERASGGWLYFKLWPNAAFDIYPDQVDFMQWLPTSPTESLIREIGYASARRAA